MIIFFEVQKCTIEFLLVKFQLYDCKRGLDIYKQSNYNEYKYWLCNLAKLMISVVLVPGAAAPAAINAIKSLKMATFKGKIVATDSSHLSAGFFMADFAEEIPEAENDSFVYRLFEIIERHNVEVLLPTSGFDIYPYSENRKKLAEIGAQAVVSDRGSLEICRDKMLTFDTLSNSFEYPFTTMQPDRIRAFPIIAKPRFGKGSRNVIKIEDELDLRYVTSKFDDMIFQEYLPGNEYTIDVLSDMNKEPIMAVPRLRIQTKAGVSTKGRIVKDPDTERECMNIAKHVGIRGPCCIQMKESAEGILKMIEINPRFGGGTIFTTLAGANFPAMIIDMLNGKEIIKPTVSEITLIRYFEEIVLRSDEREYSGTNLLLKSHYPE
jgi:carbamoyl-phosphate synthase large subunit